MLASLSGQPSEGRVKVRRACINEPLMPQDARPERPPLVVRVRMVNLRRTHLRELGRFRYHGDVADADGPDDFSVM